LTLNGRKEKTLPIPIFNRDGKYVQIQKSPRLLCKRFKYKEMKNITAPLVRVQNKPP
jgi:hypothetical protein